MADRMRGLNTDRQVKTAAAGRYTVAGVKGLMLDVSAKGSRSWFLRIQRDGRRHDVGLGPYPELRLATAREKALARRREIVLGGISPLAHRQAPRGLTFKAAAEALIENKRAGWRNAKHAAQWMSTLVEHAFPLLGHLDVKGIETAEVHAVLRPIWSTKAVTASRVRQRIEAVLDYATAMKARTGENPARWRGNLDALLPRPNKVTSVEHHAALPWKDAAAFMAELAKHEGTAGRALAFAILTAASSGEARGMTWVEVDDADMVWTVPSSRIKSGKEHRVPLTAAARALLGDRGEPDALVFPAPSDPRKALTDAALRKVLKRMGSSDLTVHGFRSTFRDWAGETTPHPREVIEHAMAHRLQDKAEAAYARGTLFPKRRKLMEDWSAFLSRPTGDVVVLPTVEREAVA